MVSVESDRTTSRVMAGGRRGTALFVPDLAVLIAGVTLFYCLRLFRFARRLRLALLRFGVSDQSGRLN